MGMRISKFGVIAFFLHAIHWPLNQLLKAGLDTTLTGRSEALLIVNYFATAFLTVVLTIVIAKLLNSLAPGVFNHLSGGRSAALSTRFAGSSATGKIVQPERDPEQQLLSKPQ